ncbi:MAG: hypothetical protein ACYTF7_09235, partial [Planctomycetota bacterium]
QVALRAVCLRDAATLGDSARSLQKFATSCIDSGIRQWVGHSLLIDSNQMPPESHLRLSA